MRLSRRLVLVAVILAGAAIAMLRPRAETVVADLMDQFDVARKQPAPETFERADMTIDDRLARVVVARGQSRLTIHTTIPDRGGALRVRFGLAPEMWQAPGDGVYFLIGVNDGVVYRQRLARLVDPFNRPADRRWHDAVVDLREYAGLTIDVVLNTRAGIAPTADGRNDVGVWARLLIVTS